VLAVLGVSVIAAFASGSLAGAAMFGVSFGAIAGAALLGWPRRSLTVVGVGVACIVWLILLGLVGEVGVGSAIAHGLGGALVGWALTDAILRTPGARANAGRVLAAAVLATLTVGAVWEVWEWTTDALIGTDLNGGIADTTLDLIADGIGAAAGGVVALYSFRAPSTVPGS
jgi:hypothetical protein